MVEHFDDNKHKLLECKCASLCLAPQRDENIPALFALMQVQTLTVESIFKKYILVHLNVHMNHLLLLQLFLIHYKDAILAESEVERNDQKNGTKATKKQNNNKIVQVKNKVQSYSRVSDMRRQLLEQRDSDPTKMLSGEGNITDASGEWRESDSGIEWVSNNQTSTNNCDTSLTENRQENVNSDKTSDMLTKYAEPGDNDCDDLVPSSGKNNDEGTSDKDSESEFDIMASQENDESFTKGMHGLNILHVSPCDVGIE